MAVAERVAICMEAAHLHPILDPTKEKSRNLALLNFEADIQVNYSILHINLSIVSFSFTVTLIDYESNSVHSSSCMDTTLR